MPPRAIEVAQCGDVAKSIGVTHHKSQRRNANNFAVRQLTSKETASLQCPISYVYDYLPSPGAWLTSQPICLPSSITSMLDEKYLETSSGSCNAISLYPSEAGLPIHSGLTCFRQCRHWEAIAEAGEDLLQLAGRDAMCAKMAFGGQTIASQAMKQLAIPAVDTYARFTTYMTPYADHNRAQLLGQSMVLVFMIDDLWEKATTHEQFDELRTFFGKPLTGNPPADAITGPFQVGLTKLRDGFLTNDEQGGNGGREVLQLLISWLDHSHPSTFTCLRDYLDYRYEDIGCSFAWAQVKFSIKSCVSFEEPKLQKILHLLGDQMIITNDIASYAKEKRAYERGSAAAFINIVRMFAETERMDDDQAKSMAYAWQLGTENQIMEELNHLHANELLDLEEWALVDACMLAISGNLLTSVVIPRYGGKETKRSPV